MITAEYYFNNNYRKICNHCKRIMPLIITYTMPDDREYSFCEDCSNAIARLHFLCMEKGTNHMYDEDEFSEIK